MNSDTDLIIRIRPLASDVPVPIRVRRLLKLMLRCFALRCVDVRAVDCKSMDDKDLRTGPPKGGRALCGTKAAKRFAPKKCETGLLQLPDKPLAHFTEANQ